MKTPKAIYTSVTASINKDGSPMIVAWRKDGGFDLIPISDGKGGQVSRIKATETIEA